MPYLACFELFFSKAFCLVKKAYVWAVDRWSMATNRQVGGGRGCGATRHVVLPLNRIHHRYPRNGSQFITHVKLKLTCSTAFIASSPLRSLHLPTNCLLRQIFLSDSEFVYLLVTVSAFRAWAVEGITSEGSSSRRTLGWLGESWQRRCV
jgi:hypothetical protein